MNDSQFREFLHGFKKTIQSKTIPELRALRYFLAGLVQMEMDQVLILVQELATLERSRTKPDKEQEEFDQITKDLRKELPGV